MRDKSDKNSKVQVLLTRCQMGKIEKCKAAEVSGILQKFKSWDLWDTWLCWGPQAARVPSQRGAEPSCAPHGQQGIQGWYCTRQVCPWGPGAARPAKSTWACCRWLTTHLTGMFEAEPDEGEGLCPSQIAEPSGIMADLKTIQQISDLLQLGRGNLRDQWFP